eukprot:Skav228026  [mRNA]  locus=scaffold1073:202692:204717:- [translate_table: standard]
MLEDLRVGASLGSAVRLPWVTAVTQGRVIATAARAARRGASAVSEVHSDLPTAWRFWQRPVLQRAGEKRKKAQGRAQENEKSTAAKAKKEKKESKKAKKLAKQIKKLEDEVERRKRQMNGEVEESHRVSGD